MGNGYLMGEEWERTRNVAIENYRKDIIVITLNAKYLPTENLRRSLYQKRNTYKYLSCTTK